MKSFPCICRYSNQAAFLGSKENSVCNGTNAEECCFLSEAEIIAYQPWDCKLSCFFFFSLKVYTVFCFFFLSFRISWSKMQLLLSKAKTSSYLTDDGFCKIEGRRGSQMVSSGFLVPSFPGQITESQHVRDWNVL